jgi:hypothetical protein
MGEKTWELAIWDTTCPWMASSPAFDRHAVRLPTLLDARCGSGQARIPVQQLFGRGTQLLFVGAFA